MKGHSSQGTSNLVLVMLTLTDGSRKMTLEPELCNIVLMIVTLIDVPWLLHGSYLTE